METMFERCEKVMSGVTHRATQLGVVNSEGCYIYTEDGRKVLDFASGVAVNNLGAKNPEVVEAIKTQLDTMIHVGHNVVYNESYVALAERLVELTGGDTKVYFSNSGAEANEGAMKLAKFYTKRPAIIAFKNSFHGRTLATISITGSNSKYRKYYEPLMNSVYWADYCDPYHDPKGMERTADGRLRCVAQFDDIFERLVDPEMVAAIIVEPVQGEGGYVVPNKEFLQGLREICDDHGICLIFDEIQTGIGRTGEFYAYQALGVQPDILTSAKALGGGVPLSAIIARKEIMDAWPAGAHGGTFGGNPLACAAGLKTLEIIERDHLLENCREMGEYFRKELRVLQARHAEIGDVRGIGLMDAIEIVDAEGRPDAGRCAEIVQKALEKNVMLLSCGCGHNVIRFIAPLIVGKEEIDTCIKVLDEAMSE